MTVRLGVYRHYKGGTYQVLGTAIHSETHEEMVIYEALEGLKKGTVFVRPKKMFLESVALDDKTVQRFTFISD